jgi:hypothetical protein
VINLEISLIKAFGWSLADIDRTSIESLIPFVMQLSDSNASEHRKFIDEVDGF